MMKTIPLALTLITLGLNSNPASGQSVSASPLKDASAGGETSEAELRYDILKGTFEPTYITFLSGWGTPGERLLFEANIAPHLSFAGENTALVLTPKIVVRMLQAESAPVRRPSFMPRISLYHQLQRVDGNRTFYPAIAATLSHHSNGQEGPFHTPSTGELNTRDGSFSLNYLEIAYVGMARDRPGGAQQEWNQLVRLGVRVNLPINEDPELRVEGPHKYGTYRAIYSGVGSAELFPGLNTLVSWDLSYVADRRFRSTPWFDLNRADASVSVVYMPPLAENAGLLLNYYWGQDYYNMSYQQRLKVFRIGVVMSSVTSFIQPR